VRLGYHDFSANSQPLGKVFAKADFDSGSSVSVTISHELLEMLGDPYICDVIVGLLMGIGCGRARHAMRWKSDDLGYTIAIPNGKKVLVSDFQTMAWFGMCPAVRSGDEVRLPRPL
jgi:hypothetical protein